MHNIGKLPYRECAQYVNKYFKMEGKGGSAWSHNYVIPYINGYEGVAHNEGIVCFVKYYSRFEFFANPIFCSFACIICEKTLFLWHKNGTFWPPFFARVRNYKWTGYICEKMRRIKPLIMSRLQKTYRENCHI